MYQQQCIQNTPVLCDVYYIIYLFHIPFANVIMYDFVTPVTANKHTYFTMECH